jgi:hypothetical protein
MYRNGLGRFQKRLKILVVPVSVLVIAISLGSILSATQEKFNYEKSLKPVKIHLGSISITVLIA